MFTIKLLDYSMSNMDVSKNKANRLNYEYFIYLSFSYTSQAPQSFHIATMGLQFDGFDGSRLNTNSIEISTHLIISCNSPFNIRYILTWALITYSNICANKLKSTYFAWKLMSIWQNNISLTLTTIWAKNTRNHRLHVPEN